MLLWAKIFITELISRKNKLIKNGSRPFCNYRLSLTMETYHYYCHVHQIAPSSSTSELILKHEKMSEKISIKIQSLTPNIIAQREYLMPLFLSFFSTPYFDKGRNVILSKMGIHRNPFLILRCRTVLGWSVTVSSTQSIMYLWMFFVLLEYHLSYYLHVVLFLFFGLQSCMHY